MTIELTTVEVREVSMRVFRFNFNLFREDHPHAEATSEFPADGLGVGTAYYLSDDFDSGYAVKSNGELVHVFSRVKGRGNLLVDSAVRNGAYRLDCFDGYLPDLYRRHGFVEHDRDANWTEGGPDVVYMYRPCGDHYYDRALSAWVCPNTYMPIEDPDFDPAEYGFTHDNIPAAVEYCERLPENFG